MGSDVKETYSEAGWVKGIRSGARLALTFFVGIFVYKVGAAILNGQFEFSLAFILNTVSTILEDMLRGYSGNLIFPAVGGAAITIALFAWYVLYMSLPVWLFLLRVITLFSVLFGLGYAASFADGTLPEWVTVIVGVAFWGLFFIVAALLGFGTFSSITGRNTRLF